jgi:hypothetical protein
MLMKPNEIGDLLAGAFGPLAILWLILGFFQQGVELRQNTRTLQLQEEALRAQVSELNASVEQQRQLVEISRKQMEAELEALRVENENQRIAAQPKFVFHGCGGRISDEVCTYSTAIRNMGSPVTNVVFSFSPAVKSTTITVVHTWDAGEKKGMQWEYHSGLAQEETVLKISFTDTIGSVGEQRFLLTPDMESNWRQISFSQIS